MPRKKAAEAKQVEITWKHSAIGRPDDAAEDHRRPGLRKLNQTVTHRDTPAIRGMARKVGHLVEVKEL